MLAITHAILVMPDHYVPDGVILIENSRIRALGAAREVEIPAAAERLNAGGLFAGPGLIDIHTHASGRTFFHDDPQTAADFALSHGVTGVLPALYYTLDQEGYFAAIDAIGKVARQPNSNIIGLYMEGPYMNPKFGADRTRNYWAGEIIRERYLPVIEKAADLAKVWVVAPEREGILGFVEDVVARQPGVVLAVGHSEASPQQVAALMPYGLRLATHHTNATGDRPRYSETRGVCVDEAVNFYDDIYAELIVDSRGIHVDPFMLRLIRKIKGEDRLILISDAFVIDGPHPPGYEDAADLNFDFEGEIAGSNLTLDIACRNMMIHTGCSIVDAFRYASRNPARLLGLQDRGELGVGRLADIVLTDAWFDVRKVLKSGQVVPSARLSETASLCRPNTTQGKGE